ncbi:efflux RND transporter periplasmic adaptor subunit [Roseibium aestuarii]|uniref:Efflux RND transporter periplasmic adaptor subunit n=1 Tax=Roseibium aestuarii TaxID=2600299 RepID=A0ABW4JRS9_9HYPH|nr:efflux RND transporter periplasmic adaptor subunit [Roseibium aestuarii]
MFLSPRFSGARLLKSAGLVLALGLGLAACQDEATDPIAEAEAKLIAQPRPARIFTVSEDTATLSRRFTGRVQPVKTVDLAFQVGGKLQELPVLESAEVKKGDLLAALDPTDYERAVREAQLRVDQAKRDLDRQETLRARSVVSQSTYDDQKNQYDLAVEALKTAEQNLAYTRLFSPFEGVVTRRLVDNFTFVTAGAAVLRLQDVSEVQIDINVPEALFARVKGEDVSNLHAEFQAFPGQSFPLVYREHSSEVDDVTQTYRITLAMPQNPDYRIQPGMSATVVANLNENPGAREALLVPTSAVAVDGAGEAYVWAFDEAAGTVSRAPVKIGVVNGDYIPVHEGLSVGDQIVSAGVSYLTDGQAVRPLR